MKKFLAILVLSICGVVAAIGAWRVATGRGLWSEAKEPATSAAIQTKQPPVKQNEPNEGEAKQPEVRQPALESAPLTDTALPEIPSEALSAAQTDVNIVALIGDYIITKDELEEELFRELQPYDYEGYSAKSKPADANQVLTRMVAEKAMIMEGRRNGVLETEMIFNAVKQFRERQLVNHLMQGQVGGRLTVSDAEIAEKMKADPKLDRAGAESAVKRDKANAIMTAYYEELYRKSDVKKASANFAKAAEIHQRLLLRPIVKRDVAFIRYAQIKNELTEAEKNIVMATFNGGKVTLEDWFETINEIAPPYRPRDLNTEAGVDRLLERTLRTPILVVEAIRLKLDENEALKKQVREYEDRNLLGDARQRVGKSAWGRLAPDAPEPNAARIRVYFDEHKDEFRDGQKLKVDQIWCANLKAAQAAKTELDEGKDFNSVKQAHSLDKESKVSDIYPGTEAYFWPELWNGEPNTVVGPVKGMLRDEFRWRVVKILEKHPGTIPEFSEKVPDRVKRTIQSEKRRAAMEEYHKELLKKYTHKIYADRIKDIDPLDIP